MSTATGRPGSSAETARLEAVRRYDIFDTPPDGAFDRITHLAARICAVPISTISIVDEDRIWFKSTHGLDVEEAGRDPGLCASAVMQDVPYIVDDARTDPRTLDNPLVRGELGLRFYAGIPLTTSGGHRLGTLNVMDVEPRRLEPGQLESLQDLAAVVMDELELRLAARSTVATAAEREAARFRDAIVAGVTHEMRTPLAVLKGLANLEEAPEGISPAEAAQMRALKRRQLNHLEWLVQQFLDYTSLEGDQPPVVQLAPTDVAAIARDARDVFPDDAHVDLTVNGARPLAVADPDRTRQIVIELINNAVRFGAGRPVEVVVGGGEKDTVEVAVTDHGPGIAPDEQAEVFSKAYRGRGSRGTGLGLYVARAFAEAQHGRIELDSELHHGSTFTLVLPAAPTTR